MMGAFAPYTTNAEGPNVFLCYHEVITSFVNALQFKSQRVL